MKWKQYPLRPDDHRATSTILEMLKVGSKTLANKLLTRFPIGTGEVFAIEMEDLDVETLPTFSCATYRSGKTLNEVVGSQFIAMGDRPIDGLLSFFTQFLQQNERGVVVMQNALWKRTDAYWNDPIRLQYCLPTCHAFFLDEVYHVLTPQETALELMEDTIREAWQHWLVGVCAECVMIPDDNLFSEEFLDELVDKTKHIFVSAFDQTGFLVWTPMHEI